MFSLSRPIGRDQAVAILHVDAEVSAYCNGDVEAFPAECWCEWTDDFFYEPGPEPTDADAARARDEQAEADALAEALADAEAEDEMTSAEFHAWLDSWAPCREEGEARDAFLGHPAGEE